MKTRLERLLAIDAEIRTGMLPSVDSLCQKFSVKSRTVYENIRVLREGFGFDIRFDCARNGYFNFNPDRLPPFQITHEEMLVLAYGIRLVQISIAKNKILEQTITSLVGKICDRLSSALQEDFMALSSGSCVDSLTDLESWIAKYKR